MSRSLARHAFTLVELLVVIAIFVLLLAIAVPAFASMLYSSEQSLADNHLRMGLAAARDAAIRSAQGADAAAVFFYDPLTGRSSILPCVKAGVIQDQTVGAALNATVDREVFVPALGFEPIQLPKGWNVRGYAAPNTIDGTWYGDSQSGANLYASQVAQKRGNWLFPETAFYNEDAPQNDDGADRQTFMVRFEGGTGVVKSWDQTPVLVLAVNPSTVCRTSPPWNYSTGAGEQPFRVDLEPDPARFVRRVASWPVAAPLQQLTQRQKLLGDISGDTVLVKPVGQLALCSEKKLALAIGARLDPATNCLYQDVSSMPGAQREPTFVTINGASFADSDLLKVNDWIENHLYNPRMSPPPIPPTSARIDSDCRIYTIHRYLGTLQEVSGTVGGEGVTQ